MRSVIRVLALPLLLCPLQGRAAAPQTRAAAVIVVDADTGRVLHEKNADKERPPASTQKLLTALIIAETGDLDKKVVVEESDTEAEPVKLYIKAGDVYTRQQLLQALLVKSPNDVARCLARDNAGSIEAFADKMNARAAALGAENSHFVNPNGLPAKGQYSTARDLSKIALAAHANPVVRDIVSTKKLTFHYADGHTKELINTNRVLRNNDFCNGMKTGYTEASGFCLVASGTKEDHDVIAVVLGSTRNSVWTDAASLLLWGFKQKPAPPSESAP